MEHFFLYLGLNIILLYRIQYSIFNNVVFIITDLFPKTEKKYPLYHFIVSFVFWMFVNWVWKKISGNNLPFLSFLFIIFNILFWSPRFGIHKFKIYRRKWFHELDELLFSAQLTSAVLYALYIFIFVEFNWV